MMQFGVHLPTGYPHCSDSSIPVAIMETAKAAEALGFSCVWVNDNVVTIARPFGVTDPISPLITLASLIHLTPRITLGVSVLVLPQRNVFIVAKQVASLDILSNGRLRLGVGVGWREDEFNVLGADFTNRGAVTDEQIQILHALWENPNVSFEGEYHQFQNASLSPRPTTGGPPIWIGGNSPAAIRRAAKFGDTWIPFALDVDELESGIAMLENLSGERKIPKIAVEMGVRVYLEGQDPPTSLPDYHFPATIAGYPDEIIETLESYQEAGLEHLLCIFYVDKIDDQLEQMRVFAEQVMPQFSQVEG